MRRHRVKIPARVAVIFAVRVQDDRRNPDRRRAQRLDVIEFLFRALEVAAVDARAAARVEVGVGVVVRRVAVEETVGEDLVDALGLPVGRGLRACTRNCKRQERAEKK